MKRFAITTAAALLAGAVHAQDARLAAPAGARDYDFQDQGVFPLIAMPGRITDVVLEPGEVLTGPVAAGDTDRWMIGDTASGSGATRRVHILVKPIAPALATNLLIMSDRRTYHLELRSSARTWFSRVGWRYPTPPVVLVSAPPARLPDPVVPDPAGSVFGYKLEGDRVAWRPERVFDDGRRTFVAFADTADLTALPPLYDLGEDSKTGELIDYHVLDRTLVVDRLIDRAELRLGLGRKAKRVRILRDEKGSSR